MTRPPLRLELSIGSGDWSDGVERGGKRTVTTSLAREDALALVADIMRARSRGAIARAFVSEGTVRVVEALDRALREALGVEKR